MRKKLFLSIILILSLCLIIPQISLAQEEPATPPAPASPPAPPSLPVQEAPADQAPTPPSPAAEQPPAPTGNQPTTQTTGISTTPLALENFIKKDSLVYSVSDKAVIFGFETTDVGVTVLQITKENGEKIKNLEIFGNSAQASSSEKIPTTNLHFYLIAKLEPSTIYLVNVIYSGGPNYFEKMELKVTTSKNSKQKGELSIINISTTTSKEYESGFATYSAINNTILDSVDKSCQQYGLDEKICQDASTIKKESGEQSATEVTATMADKFFENKIVFYGDIGLLALLLIIEIIYLARSRGAWGVVFDSKDKKPLQGAIVRVFAEENNKMLETKVTDAEGRFSFLVKPGSFYLDVTKASYRFPSKLLTKKNDEFYSDMYRGEVLHIFKSNALLNPNIPVDKIGESAESIEKTQHEISSFGKKLNYFLVHLFRIVLLVILTILNIGFVIIAYVPPLMIIAILVGLMWLLEIYAIFKKGYR